jgi:hypothetical protein
MNVSENQEQSSEEEDNVPQDPHAHLRPPFEKFWSKNPMPIPNVATVQVQSPAANETLYFAYGKDMDVSYLTHLFSSEPTFVAIAKVSKYRWVVEQSGKFPNIVSSDEQCHVYGLIYRLSQFALNIMKAKAEKRELEMKEVEAEIFEKSDMPGFWNAPLVSSGLGNV